MLNHVDLEAWSLLFARPGEADNDDEVETDQGPVKRSRWLTMKAKTMGKRSRARMNRHDDAGEYIKNAPARGTLGERLKLRPVKEEKEEEQEEQSQEDKGEGSKEGDDKKSESNKETENDGSNQFADMKAAKIEVDDSDDIQKVADMRLALALGIDLQTLGEDAKSSAAKDEEFLVTLEEEMMMGIADPHESSVDASRFNIVFDKEVAALDVKALLQHELEREDESADAKVLINSGKLSVDRLGKGGGDFAAMKLRPGVSAVLRPPIPTQNLINCELGRGTDFMGLERWQIREFYHVPGYYCGAEGTELLALGLMKNSTLTSLK